MNVPEVRFINIEYFFYKIYDFLGQVFGNGSGSNGFGNQTNTGLFGKSSFSGISFFDWLSTLFSGVISLVWVFAIIALFVLFGLMVYVYLRKKESEEKHKERYNNHFIKPEPAAMRAKNDRWEQIVLLFDSPNQNDWRAAIMNADAILDELLQSYNFQGENLGERLKNANPRVLPTIQSAWEAHKIRNKIAHEGINFVLTEHEARAAQRHFEFVFRNAGII
jgi:hypothetical protein